MTTIPPQITNALNSPDQLLQEGRGAGGGGGGGGGGRSRPRSRTCGYIVQEVKAATTSYTQSYAVRCPRNKACAYSASHLGCADTAIATTAQPTAGAVYTTCIGGREWESSYSTQSTVDPQTLACTGYASSLCQTFSLIQDKNTFTGFTCRATTLPSATVTEGSWDAYKPTSIPTPIDSFYYLATYSATTTSGALGPTTTSASSASHILSGTQPLYFSIGVLLCFLLGNI
ncbi:hypothetical protein TWF281_004595 [Arthrobotrys megalospora]